jgi:integrase
MDLSRCANLSRPKRLWPRRIDTLRPLWLHRQGRSGSTLLRERGFDPNIIEAQLAHEKLDQVAKVYDRAVYLPERRAMMERWCSYIEELKTAAKPGCAD